MTVTVELPKDIEEKLRRENPNLDSDLREACAVEMFRQRRLNHYQLSRVLGLNRYDTDAVLKRHHVEEQSLTAAYIASDQEALRRVVDQAR